MENFVTYDLAVKLKEKGFNKECFAHYDDLGNLLLDKDYWKLDSHILAPTIDQVLKWLRDEKKMHIIVEIADSGWYYTIYPSIRWENGKLKSDTYIMSFKNKASYDQAAIAGIEYCLDNLI